jgi:hypothetical protein
MVGQSNSYLGRPRQHLLDLRCRVAGGRDAILRVDGADPKPALSSRISDKARCAHSRRDRRCPSEITPVHSTVMPTLRCNSQTCWENSSPP